jgi:TCP-1/cpn60 chaperonin family.
MIAQISQLALTAFADAMEVVPRTLVRNTGTDPVETWPGSVSDTTLTTPTSVSVHRDRSGI